MSSHAITCARFACLSSAVLISSNVTPSSPSDLLIRLVLASFHSISDGKQMFVELLVHTFWLRTREYVSLRSPLSWSVGQSIDRLSYGFFCLKQLSWYFSGFWAAARKGVDDLCFHTGNFSSFSFYVPPPSYPSLEDRIPVLRPKSQS